MIHSAVYVKFIGGLVLDVVKLEGREGVISLLVTIILLLKGKGDRSSMVFQGGVFFLSSL